MTNVEIAEQKYPQQANNQFWISHNFYTYIVPANLREKDALQAKLQEMVIKYVGPQLQEITGTSIEDFRKAGNDFSYVLEPLKDIHLKGATHYNLEPPGSLNIVYIFVVIGIGFLSVSYQTIRAANYSPANALRIE